MALGASLLNLDLLVGTLALDSRSSLIFRVSNEGRKSIGYQCESLILQHAIAPLLC